MSTPKTAVEQWVERGLGVGSLGLVLLIGYILAQLTWLLIAPAQTTLIAESVKVDTQSVPKTAVNVASIQRWDLFGALIKERVRPAPAPVKPVKATETTLRLVLAGVFRAEVEEDSTAIIAEKGRPGKLYGIGDRVPGNATLVRVLADHVLLERGGRTEILRFPKGAQLGIAESRDTQGETLTAAKSKRSKRAGRSDLAEDVDSSLSSSGRNNKAGDRALSNPQTAVGRLFGGRRMPKPREVLETLNSEFQKDPESTVSDLGLDIVPMADGGGYKVSAGAPAGLIRMIGLRQGDVIRSLNGHQLGEVMQDQALYQNLMDTDEVQVEVQRGKRRFTVNVDVPF